MGRLIYMTICQRRWLMGESNPTAQLMTVFIDNERNCFRCHGCGNVAPSLAQARYEVPDAG